MARYAHRSMDANLGDVFSAWTRCPVCRNEYTGYVSLAMAERYVKVTANLDSIGLDLARVALGAATFKTGHAGNAKDMLEEYVTELLEWEDDAVEFALTFARRYLTRCFESLGLQGPLR